jgi:hypothetical protein
MKRSILVVSILAVAVVALVSASPALAAESQKGGPRNGFAGNGNRIGFGERTPLGGEIALDGMLEGIIHENLAASLGLSVPELETLVDNGESLIKIALSLGFSPEAALEILAEARTDALSQGVEEGLLSQDQADWLSSRAFGTRGYYGAGDCLVD